MSVTAPAGFEAAGVACGIKPGGAADLALVAVALGPDGRRRAVPAAATFTANRAPAAPVQVSREHLAASGGRAAAVVLNSGNANAATGSQGRKDALSAAGEVARELAVSPQEVLVCSTGLIGIPMPAGVVEAGVALLVAGLAGDQEGAGRAARAIMTTDTRPKEVVVPGAGGAWHVGGMAKGAAMLAPDMATMLAVLTTDAEASPEDLASSLREAVSASFNELTVDGSCSTNDTVVVLASGASGRAPARSELASALAEACSDLASQMAADAEGGTRVARVVVTGAAQSQLFQCSLHGADPYWGRVVAELGAAGVEMDPDRVSVAYGGVVVCAGGVAVGHDAGAVAAHMSGPRVEVAADLGLGPGRAAVLTTDLSPGYIAENMRPSPGSAAGGARSWWSSTAAPPWRGRRPAWVGRGARRTWAFSPGTWCSWPRWACSRWSCTAAAPR